MPDPASAPLLRTLPILERMRPIKGWLYDEEAELLIAAVARALAELPEDAAVVEIGSYCGRSTVVIGSVVKVLRPSGRVYAIDPHEGKVGAVDRGIARTTPTLEAFQRNIAKAQLEAVVETVRHHSWDVPWERPVAFLLIDGLHDYDNVKRDFLHFERHLVRGALVAFHDYADSWPGVRTFVDELLATGRYERVDLAASMIVLRCRDGGVAAALPQIEIWKPERDDAPVAEPAPAPELASAAPAATAASPLASCVMPTYDRRALLPRAPADFLCQDHRNAELIVVDDGPETVDDLIPDDHRIRHLPPRPAHINRRQAQPRLRGCAATFLANRDDDDWYAPWLLSAELARSRRRAPTS